MKIKNIVAYGSLALSAAALIITVHHQKYNEARFEQQQNNIKSLY